MSSARYWNGGQLLHQRPACLHHRSADIWKALFGAVLSYYAYAFVSYEVDAYRQRQSQQLLLADPHPRKAVLSGAETASKSAKTDLAVVPNCLRELGSFRADLRQSARETNTDPRLLLAIMQVESQCNSEAISARGAVGLMQVLPATAQSVGVDDLYRPSQNIRAGAKYLQFLETQVGTDLDRLLAAYHAGPSSVRRYSGIPPYKITRRYVAKVRSVYSGLVKSHFLVS